MAKFNVTELKNKAAKLANNENQDYIVIPKSGAVRPIRDTDNAMPACLNKNNENILVYKNCQFCWQNGLSL
jgi:hypothetical protein